MRSLRQGSRVRSCCMFPTGRLKAKTRRRRPFHPRFLLEPGPRRRNLFASLVRLLGASRRPLLFVGQGVQDASAELRELAELIEAPVVATRSGRGAFPEDHRLALTADFSSGAVRAMNGILDQSDLILAIGCKFTHNGTYGFNLRFAPEKLIHIDASPEVLNANYPCSMAICADALETLKALLASRELLTGRESVWTSLEFETFRKSLAPDPTLPEPRIHGVDPPTPVGFFGALRKALPGNAILVTDSGWHQVLATRHFRVLSPRGLIIPSDFQSMGFGLPAAIAAKLAAPERPVAALIGDGGLAMSGMEILTAVRERIPLTIIVFNDGALGQIRIQQLSSFGHSHATDLETPDLALFAQAVGAAYVRLEGDAARALGDAMNSSDVTLVEVPVGDSPSVRSAWVKGVARSAARRTVSPSLLRWIKSKLHL